ncbi:MAG: LysM peptidoglycan-binding domain-containing protein [Anaerolineaceae bacterium]|nr:LysM peptidoglycan-binding domain-containing protein [Anaerolineaceae bacterium]
MHQNNPGHPPGHWVILLGAILFFIATACNFPLASKPTDTTDTSIQQTLAALWLATPGVPVEGAQLGTPLTPPGEGQFTSSSLATLAPNTPAAETLPATVSYVTQPGDTLDALSKRFQVPPESISSPFPLSANGFITSGIPVAISNVLNEPVFSGALLPDSEVIFSPSAIGLDVPAFIHARGGYLSQYQIQVEEEWLSGAEVIQRVAVETSINPALLLGILEYRSGWVSFHPSGAEQDPYPIGFRVPTYQGLYKELLLVSRYLTTGYYGWRSGEFTSLTLADGNHIRIAPTLNAGSVGLQSLFAMLYGQDGWRAALYGSSSFPLFYTAFSGDPWQRAAMVEPIFPANLQSPVLELPFQPGERWSLTGGPHAAWGVGSPLGALDFAPVTGQKGCQVSTAWATASTPGLVVRSKDGVVVIDLDGDGSEQTGWNLLYLHIAREERIPVGTWVQTDGRIGHPSCEGGLASGAHVHLSRKYNGEWVSADGPLPLFLSGWRAFSEGKPYRGGLVKENQVVTAMSDGSKTSSITR